MPTAAILRRTAALALCLGLLAGCASTRTAGQPAPLPNGVETALRLGEAAAAGGDVAGAVRIFESLTVDHPTVPAPRRALADAYFVAGALPEAEQAYRQLAAIDSGSVAALIGLGRIALTKGDAAAAETHFNAVLAREPQNTTARNGLAVSLDLRGEHAQAQRHYDAILEKDPANRAVMVNRALSVALGGDPNAAVRDLDDLARAPVRVPQAAHNLALAYALAGQPEQSAAVLAAELPPDQARANVEFYRRLRR